MSSIRSSSWMTFLGFSLVLGSCQLPLIQQPLFLPSPTLLTLKPDIPKSTSPVSLPPQEQAVFLEVMKTAHQQNLQSRPLGEVIQVLAQQFLGSPYQGELLENSPTESLFLSLKRFDCVLLFETVVALAHNIVQHDDSVASFAKNVESLRYRSGHLDDYCSRLHYFSEWIADNEKRGLVQNLTPMLGGIELHQKFSFMSEHRNLYPHLKSNAEFQCLQQIESRLNQSHLTFIPTSTIHTLYPQLRSGDIVAVVTAIPGLDVTHTGLLQSRGNNAVGIIHASPGRVVQRDLDLQTYVSRVPMSVGIFVVRPI